MWGLLQFGIIEIGFYKEGGEEKTPIWHWKRTMSPSHEPIPSLCLGEEWAKASGALNVLVSAGHCQLLVAEAPGKGCNKCAG